MVPTLEATKITLVTRYSYLFWLGFRHCRDPFFLVGLTLLVHGGEVSCHIRGVYECNDWKGVRYHESYAGFPRGIVGDCGIFVGNKLRAGLGNKPH
jgi:hypothetical protein